jgi:signal transduction histidine kinase
MIYALVLGGAAVLFFILWRLEIARSKQLCAAMADYCEQEVVQNKAELDALIAHMDAERGRQAFFDSTKPSTQQLTREHLNARFGGATWVGPFADLMDSLNHLKHLFRSKADEMEVRVDTLKSFTYLVGHDMKSPLNNAYYLIDLCAASVEESGRHPELQYLNQAKRLLIDMRDMIDGLSAYAYADHISLDMERIDVGKLIRKIVNEALNATQHASDLTIEIADPLPEIFADQLLIRQALTNLISNSIKFTRNATQPKISIKGSFINGFSQITVTDNGAGIPQDRLECIFKLFKTVHSRQEFEGAGAGLAIVQRIVGRHGGSIQAYSQGMGEGATFTLSLPSKVVDSFATQAS